ncbi:MAG: hypothetical protein RL556_288 [Actinomycetota bacterium]|jgi:predicted amidohydrolase YtcJ
MTEFVDGHIHALFAGRELSGAVLAEVGNLTQLASCVASFIELNSELTWLDLSSIDAGSDLAKSLDRWALDEICEHLPLVIHTSDHHSICVNSKALEVAGFDLVAPEVAGGHFELSESKPNGWVREYSAMELIYAHQPKPTLEQDLASLLRAQDLLLEYSVVAMQEAWIDPGMPEVYLEAVARDLLKIRTNLAIRLTPEDFREKLKFATQTRLKINNSGAPLLSCNSVKIFTDGVISSGTANLLGEPSEPLWNDSELKSACLNADRLGFQLHIHATGDGGVRQAIDAIEYVCRTQLPRDRRPVIAHAERINAQDVDRLVKYDITVNCQPYWAPDAATGELEFRKLLDAGVRLSFGSDWPVNTPEPTAGLDRLRESALSNAQHRLTDEEALRAYTETAAWQMYI